jgi:hypothetical protein
VTVAVAVGATICVWVVEFRASRSEADTAPALFFVQPLLDYLAQHMNQKLVRFLDPGS